MSWLCTIGLHRWQSRTYRGVRRGRYYRVTENRCARLDCPRYSHWTIVDMEPYAW
jgi:hypothetical protein